jgi:hypothetical protein
MYLQMPRFGLPRSARYNCEMNWELPDLSKVSRPSVRIPGSLLRAKSPGPALDHSGILGKPLPDGRWSAVHSDKRGVVLTQFEDFANDRWVEVVDTPHSPEHQRAILERAYSQIGRPYNVFFANCEHFATWAFYGEPESPQLKRYLAGACAIGLGLWGLRALGGESGPCRS